jgi:formylglycine-generating enzyme required for sulfatase activity
MREPATEPDGKRSRPIHVPTLKRRLQELGLSVDDLAAQSIERGAYVSSSSLRRALRGESLSQRVREDIALVLGLELEELESGPAPAASPPAATEPARAQANLALLPPRESAAASGGSSTARSLLVWVGAAAALALAALVTLFGVTELALRDAPGPLVGVIVQPGTFTMGSTPELDALHQEDEAPLTEATISYPLWVKATEVTQREWEQLFAANPSTMQACGSDCPVTDISWWDAVRWVNTRSELEGYQACYTLQGCSGEPGAPGFQCEGSTFRGLHCDGYRLPTEAEWEHFARAGTTTPAYSGEFGHRGKNWADGLDPIAWYGGNSKVDYEPAADCSGWTEMQIPASRCGLHPVAQKQPNAWGIYDALGNVAEWTTDAYRRQLPGGAVTDPVELVGEGSDGTYWRSLRGGGWDWDARDVRVSNRHGERGSTRQRQVGFRPVRTVRTAAETPAAEDSSQ